MEEKMSVQSRTDITQGSIESLCKARNNQNMNAQFF